MRFLVIYGAGGNRGVLSLAFPLGIFKAPNEAHSPTVLKPNRLVGLHPVWMTPA
jgi:hypothetical protein